MDIVYIFLAIFSTACLISLSVFIFFANAGWSLFLYKMHSADLVAFKELAGGVLLVIGMVVSMYSGAYTMLFWMPDSWGYFDGDGTRMTFRQTASGILGFFGACALVPLGCGVMRKNFLLKQREREVKELKKIISCSLFSDDLDTLQAKLRAEADDLEEEVKQQLAQHHTTIRDFHPTMEERELLLDLALIVDDHKERQKRLGLWPG